MRFNAIYYTLFLLIMVAVFPSLTFAPWSMDSPPEPPEDPDTMMTCEGWIHHNGFTIDYEENVKLAKGRNSNVDKFASTWAAIYAFQLDGVQDIYSDLDLIADKLLPPEFCAPFGEEANMPHKYLALKDERKTCENWILLYRFNDDDREFNTVYANNINPRRVASIPFWAYFYWQAIRNHGSSLHFTAEEYCHMIGQRVGDEAKLMPLLTQVENQFSCSVWLIMFQYGKNVERNIQSARTFMAYKSEYPSLVTHWFPLEYAHQLLENVDVKGKILRVKKYCKGYHGFGAVPLVYDLFFVPPPKRILR